jgi:steroid delta-isomerase-like uncharacterized protein
VNAEEAMLMAMRRRARRRPGREVAAAVAAVVGLVDLWLIRRPSKGRGGSNRMDENARGSTRLITEVFGAGKYEVADELVAPGAQSHDAAQPAPVVGPEGAKEAARGYRSAFPDLSFTVEQTVAQGEYVATRWISRGTHQGELFGIPATGKECTVSGISVDRWQNGKIVESWTNWDTLGLLQQLGAVPAMQTA